MKKTILISSVALLAVIVLGLAGWTAVQAQSETPFGYGDRAPGEFRGMMGSGYGAGMMGNGFGAGMMGAQPEMQALHEWMYAALAEALGLTPEAFETRHAAGETFWDIAAAEGFTAEEAWDLMQQAREQALAEAVEQGIITEDYAERMYEQHLRMHGEEGWQSGGHCGGRGYAPPAGEEL